MYSVIIISLLFTFYLIGCASKNNEGAPLNRGVNKQKIIDKSVIRDKTDLSYGTFGAARDSLKGSATCTVEHDCIATNCVGVKGTPPNCVCDCKPGWQGNRCDTVLGLNLSVNLDYTSEFKCDCVNVDTWAKAVDRCTGFANGWGIASIKNDEDNRKILQLSKNQSVWLGGNELHQDRVWQWQAGRLKGQNFWSFGSADTYANWAPGEPSTGICGGFHKKCLTMVGSLNWKDVVCESKDVCSTPKCVICERSPCAAGIDCNSSGTSSASGYYPSCTCNCKPGYGGSTCNVRFCAFASDCNNHAVKLQGKYPNCVCDCMYGWADKSCGTRICDIHTDCNEANTLKVNGTYPNCSCQCMPGWADTSCGTRICDIRTDCNETNTVMMNGTYPNCLCHCKPGWEGKSCDTMVTTKHTTTLSPVPTIPSTTTLSPVPTMHSISTLSPVPTMPILLVITLLLSYSHVLSRLLS